MNLPLARALERPVLVVVGSGGVGKTTTSAALGLQAALDGRKVLVCTIDPARRLANSMGLSSIGNTEARVGDVEFASLGTTPRGELWAMMLDLKRSWDEVIRRNAKTPEQRDAILNNRFYVQLSTALAGSHEYVAMEKLYALHQQGRYDLIILDTPPTTQALDFLDAPNRVIDFLDNDFARFLGSAGAAAGRAVVQLGSAYMSRILARFTGAGTLEELAKFMTALGGMYDGFKERAAAVRALLVSERAGFVLVTSPSEMAIEEAHHFHQLLLESRLHVHAIVANRVNPDFKGQPPTTRDVMMQAAAELNVPAIPGLAPLRDRLWSTLEDEQTLHDLDRAKLNELEKRCAPTPLVRVTRFDHDVHDLAGLAEVNDYLFGRRNSGT